MVKKTQPSSSYPHIGTIEKVSLVKHGIENVPAKIDTGADGSAIWASAIRVKKGKLNFNFFAPGSMYYNGEIIQTSAYRIGSVRNSFGHKEFRYRIRLKVRLGEQEISRWFTLADRSHNTYPILLGKNFLKNKFIVDVAQKNLHGSKDDPQKILILVAQEEENQEFFKELEQYNRMPVEYSCVRYGGLAYFIDGPNTRVFVTKTGQDIASYAFTYIKNHFKGELARAVAEYLDYKHRPFVDREFVGSISASKLTEYMKLMKHGLPVPATLCASTPYMREQFEWLKDNLGLPFILKEMKSDRGRFNYFIDNKNDFLKILEEAAPEHIYLAQKYIHNDGFYRIYIMNSEAGLAVWRSAIPRKEKLKSHLNKPSGSANASSVPIAELDQQVEKLAVEAAHCLNRQIAGIDLIQDKNTKKWYVLEANNDPQLRGGSFVHEKASMFAKFIDKVLNQ